MEGRRVLLRVGEVEVRAREEEQSQGRVVSDLEIHRGCLPKPFNFAPTPVCVWGSLGALSSFLPFSRIFPVSRCYCSHPRRGRVSCEVLRASWMVG